MTASDANEFILAIQQAQQHDAEKYDSAADFAVEAIRNAHARGVLHPDDFGGKDGFDEAVALLPVGVEAIQERLNHTWSQLRPALTALGGGDLSTNMHIAPLRNGRLSTFSTKQSVNRFIFVNDALHDVIYHCAKAMTIGKDIRVVGDQTPFTPDDAALDLACRVTLLEASSLRVNASLWQPIHIAVGGVQLKLAVDLTEAAMRFIVAHEFGHHYLSHLEASDTEVMAFGPIETLVPHAASHNETAADLFAARCVLNPDGLDEVPASDDLFINMAGILLALEAMALYDHHYFVTPSVSHPPPAQRIATVYAQVGFESLDEAHAFGYNWLVRDFFSQLDHVTSWQTPLRTLIATIPRFSIHQTNTTAELLEEVDWLDQHSLIASRALSSLYATFAHTAFQDELHAQAADLEERATIALGMFAFDQVLADLDEASVRQLMSPPPGTPYVDWFATNVAQVPQLRSPIFRCIALKRIQSGHAEPDSAQ